MNRELPDHLYQRIVQLSEEGNVLADEGNYDNAIALFEHALAIIPEPKYEWAAATWLYTAIGDTQFLSKNYEAARIAFNTAALCPDALEKPFIWLRRSQVYFELGDSKLADDCLASAYMLGGKEIFDGENPKYANHISARLRPPNNA